MSGRFRRIYPGSEVIMFDGGLNNKFERSIIEDNESPDCLNVVFTNGGAETREGAIKLNSNAVGSYVCDGIYTREDNTGAETMVAFFGGNMYDWSGSTFTTIPSAQSVFTAGVRVATAQYENYMFIGNGSVAYKYNGAEFTRHGVPAPTSTATAASQDTGVLTGDYLYKVTYVNSNAVEGDVSPVTTTFTAASATIRLSSIPTAPVSHGVGSRRIYRTEAGGSTFKRVTEISDNSTTTYDDNNADSALGATAPTDNGEPPNYSVCVYHANRLFVNDPDNPNYLWYSDLGEPYTFQSTNFIKVGDNTTDVIRAITVYNNSIVCKCDRSDTLIYMPDSTASNWESIKLKSPYGCKSPFGTFNFNNKQMFPAMDNDKFVGFAALAGATTDTDVSLLSVSAAGSDLKSNRIEPDMFNVQETYVGNISSIVFKNKAYITLTYGSGQTQNNRIYVYDFSLGNLRKSQEGSWVPWTGLNAAQFTIYDGKLYYGTSTATGFVYQLESGTGVYNDDGAAIDSYLWTKEFTGAKSEVNFHKDFRYANILLENAGDWFMNIAYRVDSDKGSGNNIQIDLDPGASLWGTMVWGRDTWGGGQDEREERLFLANARGKRIQFKFSNQNTADQKFKVHWMKFAYNTKGYR